jgi:hypothetical protein
MLASVVDQARSFFPPAPAPQDITTPVPAATPPAVPKPTIELSYFPVPVGFASPDRAAIVGREGFLFPLNDLPAQYAADPKEQTVQRDAAKWFALFRARQTALAQRGITYIQTIMPDRATVLGNLAPPGLGPVTARLGVLEAMIDMVLRRDGPEAVAWYRSLIGALRGFHGAGIAPYLRYDSHLRTAATQLVFYQFVQKLAALRPDREAELMNVADYCGELKPGGENDAFAGDLGAHFGLPLYETEKIPDLARFVPLATGKPVVARIPRQGETGTRLMWRNPVAPSSLRIVAFGGSVFGRGDAARDLSWWFKAMFAEFHFVWSGELDLAYLDQHKPDVVICQSVEDALPVVVPR